MPSSSNTIIKTEIAKKSTAYKKNVHFAEINEEIFRSYNSNEFHSKANTKQSGISQKNNAIFINEKDSGVAEILRESIEAIVKSFEILKNKSLALFFVTEDTKHIEKYGNFQEEMCPNVAKSVRSKKHQVQYRVVEDTHERPNKSHISSVEDKVHDSHGRQSNTENFNLNSMKTAKKHVVAQDTIYDISGQSSYSTYDSLVTESEWFLNEYISKIGKSKLKENDIDTVLDDLEKKRNDFVPESNYYKGEPQLKHTAWDVEWKARKHYKCACPVDVCICKGRGIVAKRAKLSVKTIAKQAITYITNTLQECVFLKLKKLFSRKKPEVHKSAGTFVPRFLEALEDEQNKYLDLEVLEKQEGVAGDPEYCLTNCASFYVAPDPDDDKMMTDNTNERFTQPRRIHMLMEKLTQNERSESSEEERLSLKDLTSHNLRILPL